MSGQPGQPVLLLDGRAGEDLALEVALAQTLLERVGRHGGAPVLRCYRALPTVAFGRRDTLAPGFAAAAAAARAHGFEPVVRAPGGHAAAYHEDCIVLDEVMPADDAVSGMQERFAAEAARQVAALRSLGVDARIGEVPGEYCPGAFTVNARGAVKLIGTAQRLIRGAWLLSTIVVVDREGALRAVLEDVYAALDLHWDPATVGSVATEAAAAAGGGSAASGGAAVTVADVERALLATYARRYRLEPAELDPELLDAAAALQPRHRIG
jgi:lipoate-protein ligase A